MNIPTPTPTTATTAVSTTVATLRRILDSIRTADTDREVLGVLIGRLRGEKKMTQQELADRLGVSKAHVSDVENGKRTLGPGPLRKLEGLVR